MSGYLPKDWRGSNAGFPSPQRLLSWGRLIVAGHLLEDRHRSADRIAVALDYSSGSALRNVCQRYLRATPSEIRARGGAAYVLRTLLQEVGASDRAIALFEDNRPAGPDKEVAARLAVS